MMEPVQLAAKIEMRANFGEVIQKFQSSARKPTATQERCTATTQGRIATDAP